MCSGRRPPRRNRRLMQNRINQLPTPGGDMLDSDDEEVEPRNTIHQPNIDMIIRIFISPQLVDASNWPRFVVLHNGVHIDRIIPDASTNDDPQTNDRLHRFISPIMQHVFQTEDDNQEQEQVDRSGDLPALNDGDNSEELFESSSDDSN